jgi:hypothetical protein
MKKVLIFFTLFFAFSLSTQLYGADLYLGQSHVSIWSWGIMVECDPPQTDWCCVVFEIGGSTMIHIFTAGQEGYVEYTVEPNTDVTYNAGNNSISFVPEH